MATVEKFIEVDVPVTTAYNQWTQFESFPRFMEGVEDVKQISDTRTHWRTNIGGVRREFDAEITEQHPDERIAWTSMDRKHAGVVTFHRLSPERTRIMVQIGWQPEGVAEKAGAAVQADDMRVNGDLKRFKEFVEESGSESGGWRGEVQRPQP